jgi:hypothetical protein
LDIVTFDKSSFIARHDEPGPCPGDGWQLIAAHGARGDLSVFGLKQRRKVQVSLINRALLAFSALSKSSSDVWK